MRRPRPALLLALVAAGWTAVDAAAQMPTGGDEPEPLVTDRPDFTESAETVQPGRLQLEAGYTFARSGGVRDHTFGELLARIGVLDRAELRLGLNSYQVVEGPGGDASGLQDLSLGLKAKLAEGATDRFEPLRPTVAILLSADFPTGADEVGSDAGAAGGTIALAWPLTPRLSLGSNLGVAWLGLGDDEFAEFSGSLALGVSIGRNAGVYVETYGFSSPDPAGLDAAFLNGGLTFAFGPDLQVDGRVGVGFDNPRPNYFAGLGFAFRW